MHILSLVLLVASVLKVSSAAISCNATNPCPIDTPCCDQYGLCGVGSFCLAGCNPLWSYNMSACMPQPICKNSNTSFTKTNQFLSEDDYYGDASQSDWTYQGTILEYDDSIILAMTESASSTVVSSTRFIWYGHIDARIKSSHLAGVVTAFILFSNVQDEVDYENVGVDLYKWQTNYYYQGILNWTHSKNITTTDSTFDNYHVLGIDWTEDRLQWIVNGEVGRTLYKNETWNATSQSYYYPQTPSRIQISLWAGGASKDIGTVDWAGGAIDWSAPDLTDPGYYYAFIDSANITCYDPPSGTKQSGTNAYIYTGTTGNQSDVEITDDKTWIGSTNATGFNPQNSGNTSNITLTKSSDGSTPTGLGTGGHADGDDGEADSNNDGTTYTYTGSGFIQFASSTSSAFNVSNLASVRVDASNLFNVISLAAVVIATMVLM
ncbi:Utr2 protein [Saccharomycopsis crataegensis]|uniref:Utr2 protein n=1 Tax=Saccharomycopsis crataegensis TaxID=43959 RepID=A0AAV5QFB3_9ASCO|nr:Utr2 protein [Saccharomycopsis crataegensis]